MKVGIVHTHYQQKGGEDVMVALETFYLQQQGVEVCSLIFSNKKSKGKQFFDFLLSPFNFISCKKVSAWLAEEKPDVVHVHNWHFALSPAIFFIIRKKGIPVVHTLHNFRLICPSATLLYNNKIFLQSLKSHFPWKAIFNKVYNNSFVQTFYLSFTIWLHKILRTWQMVNRFIVLTENAKNIFLSSTFPFEKDQLVVKSNFIADFDGIKNKRGQHFLFVGRLSDEKGIHTLLDAFTNCKMKLLIIGDGPLKEAVIKKTAEHSNIIYLGFQDRDKILAALSTCSALIFPSIWYEGFPLTIIEAFACGTPVIASDIGAMETMIVDQFNGLHFECASSNSLLEKIQFWNDMGEGEKEIFGQNALQTFKQSYTPEKNIDQLIAIYNAVICELKEAENSFHLLSKQTV